MLATRREVRELLVGQIGLGVQLADILVIEFPRDGFVDVGDRCVIPEMFIFLFGSETINLSGADAINNRIEEA